MTGAAPPRHIERRLSEAHTRSPRPQDNTGADFPSLLDRLSHDDDAATSAGPFDGSGVLGRRERAHDAPAVATSAPTPLAPAQQESLSERAIECEAAAHKLTDAAETAIHLPDIPTSRPPLTPTSKSARCGDVRVSNAAAATSPMAKSTPDVERRSGATPSPQLTQRPPPRTHANAIFVAIHALQQSCAIYARTGRMSATERENLRNSIRALLAEHGLSIDAIAIDGEYSNAESGWDRWR